MNRLTFLLLIGTIAQCKSQQLLPENPGGVNPWETQFMEKALLDSQAEQNGWLQETPVSSSGGQFDTLNAINDAALTFSRNNVVDFKATTGQDGSNAMVPPNAVDGLGNTGLDQNGGNMMQSNQMPPQTQDKKSPMVYVVKLPNDIFNGEGTVPTSSNSQQNYRPDSSLQSGLRRIQNTGMNDIQNTGMNDIGHDSLPDISRNFQHDMQSFQDGPIGNPNSRRNDIGLGPDLINDGQPPFRQDMGSFHDSRGRNQNTQDLIPDSPPNFRQDIGSFRNTRRGNQNTHSNNIGFRQDHIPDSPPNFNQNMRRVNNGRIGNQNTRRNNIDMGQDLIPDSPATFHNDLRPLHDGSTGNRNGLNLVHDRQPFFDHDRTSLRNDRTRNLNTDRNDVSFEPDVVLRGPPNLHNDMRSTRENRIGNPNVQRNIFTGKVSRPNKTPNYRHNMRSLQNGHSKPNERRNGISQRPNFISDRIPNYRNEIRSLNGGRDGNTNKHRNDDSIIPEFVPDSRPTYGHNSRKGNAILPKNRNVRRNIGNLKIKSLGSDLIKALKSRNLIRDRHVGNRLTVRPRTNGQRQRQSAMLSEREEVPTENQLLDLNSPRANGNNLSRRTNPNNNIGSNVNLQRGLKRHFNVNNRNIIKQNTINKRPQQVDGTSKFGINRQFKGGVGINSEINGIVREVNKIHSRALFVGGQQYPQKRINARRVQNQDKQLTIRGRKKNSNPKYSLARPQTNAKAYIRKPQTNAKAYIRKPTSQTYNVKNKFIDRSITSRIRKQYNNLKKPRALPETKPKVYRRKPTYHQSRQQKIVSERSRLGYTNKKTKGRKGGY